MNYLLRETDEYIEETRVKYAHFQRLALQYIRVFLHKYRRVLRGRKFEARLIVYAAAKDGVVAPDKRLWGPVFQEAQDQALIVADGKMASAGRRGSLTTAWRAR